MRSDDRHDDEREPLASGETGVIKYGIAYLLGVPLSLLILIFLVSRAC